MIPSAPALTVSTPCSQHRSAQKGHKSSSTTSTSTTKSRMPTAFSTNNSTAPSAARNAPMRYPSLSFDAVSFFASAPCTGGRSARLERPNTRKKVSVVRKLTGLPGRSRRPASSMRPFSSRPDTLDEESTPRTCSIKARDTGWL